MPDIWQYGEKLLYYTITPIRPLSNKLMCCFFPLKIKGTNNVNPRENEKKEDTTHINQKKWTKAKEILL